MENKCFFSVAHMVFILQITHYCAEGCVERGIKLDDMGNSRLNSFLCSTFLTGSCDSSYSTGFCVTLECDLSVHHDCLDMAFSTSEV